MEEATEDLKSKYSGLGGNQADMINLRMLLEEASEEEQDQRRRSAKTSSTLEIVNGETTANIIIPKIHPNIKTKDLAEEVVISNTMAWLTITTVEIRIILNSIGHSRNKGRIL